MIKLALPRKTLSLVTKERIEKMGKDGLFSRFKGKTFVIKIGGRTLAEEANLEPILSVLVSLRQNGAKVVVVHGGGPEISRRLEAAGVAGKFNEEGLRETSREAAKILAQVLDRENKSLVARLTRHRVSVNGLDSNHRLVTAKPIEIGGLGFAGHVEHIRLKTVEHLLKAGNIVVVSPLGWIENDPYNINADEVAAAFATTLSADWLLLLTDVPAVQATIDGRIALLKSLPVGSVSRLIEAREANGGMVPKLRAAAQAAEAWVPKIFILPASPEALTGVLSGVDVGTRVAKNAELGIY